MNPIEEQKETEKKDEAIKNESCHHHHAKLWCLTIMAIAIIVLMWLPSYAETWSKIIVTILASLIFIRSTIFNCCK